MRDALYSQTNYEAICEKGKVVAIVYWLPRREANKGQHETNHQRNTPQPE